MLDLISSVAPGPALSLAAVTLLALATAAVLLQRRRRARAKKADQPLRDALDTVVAWQPEAARVMTAAEREAFDTLRKALPSHLVLAQVPLSRFLRVPRRHSYRDWLQRVGIVSADLLVCDSGSRVLAVVDVRGAQESQRSRQRHQRMADVLRAAGIRTLVWQDDNLPTAEQVRAQMIPVLQEIYGKAGTPAPQASVSKPLPLIPVAEMEEILAEGDAAMAHNDAVMEPVPSTFYDDFDAAPIAANSGRR
jgi:Protein of unknown function (DUF2726)